MIFNWCWISHSSSTAILAAEPTCTMPAAFLYFLRIWKEVTQVRASPAASVHKVEKTRTTFNSKVRAEKSNQGGGKRWETWSQLVLTENSDWRGENYVLGSACTLIQWKQYLACMDAERRGSCVLETFHKKIYALENKREIESVSFNVNLFPLQMTMSPPCFVFCNRTQLHVRKIDLFSKLNVLPAIRSFLFFEQRKIIDSSNVLSLVEATV